MDGQPYFPASTDSCPTFVDDSEWLPLIDGAAYLPELSARLDELTAGDTLLIHAFEFEPHLDLDGRPAGEPGHRPIGARLAVLAQSGVDVRVILAGERVATILPIPALAGFRRNVSTARRLQSFRPAAYPESAPPPLRGRVALDKSGPLVGSNHMKSVAMLHGGRVTAFTGGIDMTADRFDAGPHDTMRAHGRKWGWHDAAVRLRGPAAARAYEVLAARWTDNADRRRKLISAPLASPPGQAAQHAPRTAVRVVRSTPPVRRHWRLRNERVTEVYDTLTTAIAAAHRYVYIEDQYLAEQAGGHAHYELYAALREAAARGVKLILVGSGVRDRDDPGIHVRPINRTVNTDIRRKILDRLDVQHRDNVAVFRVAHVTVHAKIVLIDDRFACVGSANLFSRSMSGTDRELSAAVATEGGTVRELRVRLWAEHLRTPVSAELRPALDDLDVALGIWRTEWTDAPSDYWRRAGRPAGFEPGSRALSAVPRHRRFRAGLG